MTDELRVRSRGVHVVRAGSTSGHVTTFAMATIVISHDFESLRERRTISGVPGGISGGSCAWTKIVLALKSLMSRHL